MPGDSEVGCSPPGSEVELDFGPPYQGQGNHSQMYVAVTYCNDGFELWLGTWHKWIVFYEANEARRLAWRIYSNWFLSFFFPITHEWYRYGLEDARKLAWFTLWDWWTKSTWFGLKRRLWYWALRVRCERFERRTGEQKENVI